MRPSRSVMISLLIPAVLGFASAALCQTTPPTPSNWDAWLQSAKELQQRASAAVHSAIDYAQPLPRHDGIAMLSAPGPGSPGGLVRTPLAEAKSVPERVIILVHGLDEPGSIWDDLAPVLVDHEQSGGFRAALFVYPDDQPIAKSTALFVAQLRELHARGVRHVDLVCHSMGGLVARDALTRADVYAGRAAGHRDLPDVDRLILVGTPLGGSPWARLRAVAEMKEQIEHWATDKSMDPRQLLGFMNDGDGGAGSDLLPGSPFLTDLNARPWPTGARITIVIGTITPTTGPDLSWVRNSAFLRHVMGDEQTDRLVASLDELAHSVGDGVVSVDSATPRGLPAPTDIVRVEGSHRGMLKDISIERHARSLVGQTPSKTPAAIPVVLDRLGVEAGSSQP